MTYASSPRSTNSPPRSRARRSRWRRCSTGWPAGPPRCRAGRWTWATWARAACARSALRPRRRRTCGWPWSSAEPHARMRALYDVPAPAKLNLFLHVTGRRADGYHLLQSAFMLIDWCDTLHFEKRPAGHLSRQDLGPALPADDLCLRAARALQQACGSDQGAHIAILKRVPAEAGLGGGSSDAASCLLALNQLWGLGMTLAALERIGVALGADVPFFLRGHNAWVEGIGEQIRPIPLPR